jgi:phosphate:Na+ symporter
LTITALAAGQITYENALALAIGANVGTTITAILGAMSANEAGKRLAAAHLIFNVLTGVIAIIFIYQLVALVNELSSFVGIADGDYTLKLAVFHTIFNLLGIIVTLPMLNFLVVSLEKYIPEKKPEVDQPKYLSDSSAVFPGTAVEAVRMETMRVYEAALRIIIDGLGMKSTEVVSDTDLKQTLAAQNRIHRFDINAMYERHIKAIYSAIVAFISETTFSRREESSADLQWLRETNVHLVGAVKDVGLLQENLIYYVGSEKQNMRGVYNQIRLQVGLIIRDLEELRVSGAGVIDALSLDALKLLVDEERDNLNQTISELIGERAITPDMGSSLINDGTFAHQICTNLISAAQTLFVVGEQYVTQAAHDVLLDKSDLTQIGEQTGREN